MHEKMAGTYNNSVWVQFMDPASSAVQDTQIINGHISYQRPIHELRANTNVMTVAGADALTVVPTLVKVGATAITYWWFGEFTGAEAYVQLFFGVSDYHMWIPNDMNNIHSTLTLYNTTTNSYAEHVFKRDAVSEDWFHPELVPSGFDAGDPLHWTWITSQQWEIPADGDGGGIMVPLERVTPPNRMAVRLTLENTLSPFTNEYDLQGVMVQIYSAAPTMGIQPTV